MDKMTMKRELKNVKRDLEYYMNEYNLTQKEAYEVLHTNYYIRMWLTKNYVEVEARERIYNSIKNNKEEGEQK